MVLLSLFCVSAFTLSTSSGAPVVDNCNAYTKESPTKSLGGFGLKQSNGIPEAFSQEERTPRILNGEEAFVGEFPWMASIHWNSKERQGHQCGGSIISPKHILTAAHCLQDAREDELSQLTVLVGGHFRDESLEPRAQRITVKKAIKYSDYNLTSHKHDIAILVLEKEIKLNKYTAIISLPSEEYLYGDVNAVAAGWGKTDGNDPFVRNNKDDPTATAPTRINSDRNLVSPVLKATNLTIFNNTECNQVYEKFSNYQFDNNTICAAASDQTGDLYPGDTTPGDSGGPLFLKENEKWVVIGITSLGHQSKEPLPGVYTRVSAYLYWIKGKMCNV